MRRLFRDTAGAAVTEFAILAPVFFVFLFGAIEGSRLMFMQQTVEVIAHSTARCMSVSSTCDSVGNAKAYGVDRAGELGIAIVAGDVVAQQDVTCRGFPHSNRATVTADFESVMGGLMPVFPEELVAESCYPVLATE